MLLFSACKKKNQEIYLLQPFSGENQVVQVGDQVELNGEEFGNISDYSAEWKITDKPASSNSEITEPTKINTHFYPDVAGTYTISLKTFRNDQYTSHAHTVTVVDDISTVQSSVLFVNTIEGTENLYVSVNGDTVNEIGIDAFSHSEKYEKIISGEDKEFNFHINGIIKEKLISLAPEKNYTICLAGTLENLEIIVHENIWNEKTIGATTADDGIRKNDAIYVIHAASELGDLTMHTASMAGYFSLDFLIKFRNIDEEIAEVKYLKSKTALIGHTNTAAEFSTWAQSIDNDDTTHPDNAITDVLTLTPFGDGEANSGWFITFVIVKDSESETGYRIIYINNTFL